MVSVMSFWPSHGNRLGTHEWAAVNTARTPVHISIALLNECIGRHIATVRRGQRRQPKYHNLSRNRPLAPPQCPSVTVSVNHIARIPSGDWGLKEILQAQ